MGNCIDRQRVATWVDDEEEEYYCREEEEEEKEEVSASRDQVKIKINKKQLNELVQRGLSVEQVVAEIMGRGHVCVEDSGRRQWRPALNSIPEVPEWK